MLRLSKKSDYALIAMKHLALRPESGASSSAREISEAYDIPLELLAKVLQRLVRARLLVSVQGTRGGYRLGRSASTISVADVIQAVDGPVTVTGPSTAWITSATEIVEGPRPRRYPPRVPCTDTSSRARTSRCSTLARDRKSTRLNSSHQ